MIAEVIAAYLKEKGITQACLCEKTGLTESCVSRSLCGKRKLSVEEYKLICWALQVGYDFFFQKAAEVHF